MAATHPQVSALSPHRGNARARAFIFPIGPVDVITGAALPSGPLDAAESISGSKLEVAGRCYVGCLLTVSTSGMIGQLNRSRSACACTTALIKSSLVLKE